MRHVIEQEFSDVFAGVPLNKVKTVFDVPPILFVFK